MSFPQTMFCFSGMHLPGGKNPLKLTLLSFRTVKLPSAAQSMPCQLPVNPGLLLRSSCSSLLENTAVGLPVSALLLRSRCVRLTRFQGLGKAELKPHLDKCSWTIDSCQCTLLPHWPGIVPCIGRGQALQPLAEESSGAQSFQVTLPATDRKHAVCAHRHQ